MSTTELGLVDTIGSVAAGLAAHAAHPNPDRDAAATTTLERADAGGLILFLIIMVVVGALVGGKTKKCDVCGADISKRARTCPRCGDPQ